MGPKNKTLMSIFSENYRKSKFDDAFSNRYYENEENEAFEDLDVNLPKLTDLGYYIWIGKDYCNIYHKDINRIDDHASDQFSRTEIPRMPWRDQGMVVFGESARDLARHFIQRWNQTKVILKTIKSN